jgi:subtilisin family serine protease
MMKSNIRRTWLVAAFLALAVLFAIGPGPMAWAAANDDDEIDFEGTVISAPDDANGVGLWRIRDDETDDPRTRTLRATDETEFDKGVPVVGDRVDVRAVQEDDGTLHALEIERQPAQDDGGGDDDQEYEGVVLLRPEAADGVGEWSILTEYETTLAFVATAETRIDTPVPAVGDWIEVEGQPGPDGVFQATRIKPDDYEASEVVVRLATGVAPEGFAARHGMSLGSAVLASGDIYLFRLDDELEDARNVIQTLSQDADAIWAELNFVGGAPVGDPYRTWGWGGTEPTEYENQQAFAQVSLGPAAAVATGRDVVVAVLDTGADLTHPGLAGLYLEGRDLIDDDLTPAEVPNGIAWGHGTHTTGIIAHIAPESRILPVRVLDANGRGNTFLLAYAIEWAVEQGADVINLSLGTPFDSAVLRSAVADAVAQGVVIVAAAGNDNTETPQYPAAYPGVITVTAVDAGGVKADFANYGRDWVDLAAPGVGIVSTIIGPEGSGYATWSGTSMAAPFAAGAAALVADHLPAADVGQLLLNSAANLDDANPDHAGQIGGMLNIALALDVEDEPGPEPRVRIFMPVVLR